MPQLLPLEAQAVFELALELNKDNNLRGLEASHLGQRTPLPDSLMPTNFSNFSSHLLHSNSYMGISTLLSINMI